MTEKVKRCSHEEKKKTDDGWLDIYCELGGDPCTFIDQSMCSSFGKESNIKKN